MKILTLSIALVCLAACVDRHNGATVRAAEANNVFRCQKVGQVTGAPSLRGTNAPNALDDSRADAMRQAASYGADTVVWLDMSSAHALTYKCFQ